MSKEAADRVGDNQMRWYWLDVAMTILATIFAVLTVVAVAEGRNPYPDALVALGCWTLSEVYSLRRALDSVGRNEYSSHDLKRG